MGHDTSMKTEQSSMTLRPFADATVVGRGPLTVALLPTGDVQEINADGVMYTGFSADAVSGAVGALYLRVYGDGAPEVHRLTGRGIGRFGACADGAVYEGTAGGIAYRIRLQCTADTWYYTVTLSGRGRADVLYTQDIGVGDRGFIRNNELYAAQYLGHTVRKDKYGYTVASRQNLGGRHPVLVQGALDINVVGYCTDGLQFFGSAYRVTGKPALIDRDLPNVNHQYEMPFICLATERFDLDGERTFAFYGHTISDLPTAAEGGLPDGVEAAYRTLPALSCPTGTPAALSEAIGAPLSGAPFSDEEIAALYPDRIQEERADGTLYSFFTPDRAHAVTIAKEAAVQRPHGDIMIGSFDVDEVPHGLVSNTSYMYGLFCSQTLVGNTSFHKLLSVARGFLDTDYTSGLRIYAETDGRFRRLAVASLFEMGVNYCRYLNKLPDDVLEVKVYVSFGRPQVNVELHAGRPRRYLVTMQTIVGEDNGPVNLCAEGRTLSFTPAAGPALAHCPGLNYRVDCDQSFALSDDRVFFADGQPRNGTLVTLTLSGDFGLRIAGGLTEPAQTAAADFADAANAFRTYYDGLLRGARITGAGAVGEKLDIVLYWYAHDCLIHYASPHGLEQSGGAAWGTRDVCQGPAEFFMTFGYYRTVRNILRKVFAYQGTDGEWPQWFMFDEYPYAAGDCHGDIVFWPLKVLADYLSRTGDKSILDEAVRYRDADPQPIGQHVGRALDSIGKRFIAQTGLLTYAGGDWDDTLQPVSAELKEKLVSSWTMALAYQTLKALADVTDGETAGICAGYAARIRDAFNRDLIGDGTIAGFGYVENGSVVKLLHPSDTVSGIHLRLLPLTRSIIAGLVSPEQAARNVERIESLRCPDGVRLMDAPAPYNGGVSRMFVRAEQAANVGREISLQYVHAHIRYIEAMAALGRADDALWGLMAINPVNIRDVVPNAMPRQANCYASSSEGLFNDRYEYRDNFYKLKDGSVPVRSGWRVYSSGGGIYLARLIGDVLGVRFSADGLELDPVLSARLDGLRFTFTLPTGRSVTAEYRVTGERKAVTGGETFTATGANPYRPTGIFLPYDKTGDTITVCC